MASILVVEDEKIVAADIHSTLVSLGYTVPGVVSSGEEAVRRVAELHPDLVLMDIMLGGQMDGVQAARLMRQRFSVPVVFLTAFADGDSLNRARASEPFGYIVKPFSEKELRSTIEIALYKHGVEKHLRERERWFSTTLRCVGDGVIATDPMECVTFINPVAEALAGWRAEEAQGKSIGEIFQLVDQQSGAQTASPIRSVLRGQAVEHLEHAALIDRRGSEISIDYRAAPIIDEQGVLLGAVMVFRDVTERKRTERRLLLSDRLVSLGAMAAGVVHEVNNPLTYVIGNLGFAVEELTWSSAEIRSLAPSLADSPQAQQVLGRINATLEALKESRQGAERVQGIMQELGTFSRGEDEHSSQVQLPEILEAALKITATQVGQRARVIRDFRPVPSVDANAAKLGQVFVNLLVNAAQALVRGSVEKDEIRVVTYTDPAGRAVVEIRDSGSGIPREALSRIFEPFYTTKPTRTGRGLGLAICHEIVAALGGAITVESEPGRGSTFRVLLPHSSDENGISKAPRRSAGETRRGRILVVDDEPIVGASIRRTLAKEHEVVVVSSGREAIGLIRGGHYFDVILSDVMMPEMSGIDFYRELARTLPDTAERMVFLTGGAFTPGARKFLDSVSNPSLEKPFDPDRLRDFVRDRLV